MGRTDSSPEVINEAKKDFKKSGFDASDYQLKSSVKDTLKLILSHCGQHKKIKTENSNDNNTIAWQLVQSPSSSSQFNVQDTIIGANAATSEWTESPSEVDDTSAHLIPHWTEKIKEGFVERVAKEVVIEGEKVLSKNCKISIVRKDDKYVVNCPICGVMRAIASGEPMKLNTKNLLKHFNDHKEANSNIPSTTIPEHIEQPEGHIHTTEDSTELPTQGTTDSSLKVYKVIF